MPISVSNPGKWLLECWGVVGHISIINCGVEVGA